MFTKNGMIVCSLMRASSAHRVALLVATVLSVAARAQAQPEVIPPPPSLKTVPVPEPTNLFDFVKDKEMAKKLGKAFFWEMQAGSDGIQACATCHFQAGADPRNKNQLSPGLLDGDTTFQVGGPNYALQPSDFPFTQFNDPLDRNSGISFHTNDVVSSQGVCNTTFNDVVPGNDVDDCTSVPDPVFNVAGINTRRVEPRNAASVINAVFNHRNFHDGRANFEFNGVNPFGPRDPDAKVWMINPDNSVMQVSVLLDFASLASQAVGPPLSGFEMSCAGRTFPKLGKKLLSLTPLDKQHVDMTDSLLGGLANPVTGLSMSYEDLIKAAFHEKWWDSAEIIGGEFSVMQANFSLFWGIAIQLYEATLVSDESPFDKFVDPISPDPNALSDSQKRGLDLFLNEGRCVNCHKGAEFSGAAISHLGPEAQEEGLVERMLMNQGGIALYDNGFYNIGVTKTQEDVGVGGMDPFGNPLSFTRQYIGFLLGIDPPDNFQIDPCKFEIRFPLFWLDGSRPFDCNGDHIPDTAEPTGPDDIKAQRVAVDGAFKTSILRNVELTGPYMHNGGMKSLEEVLEFYTRGGNFSNFEQDPDIQVLDFDAQDRADVVNFLKSLTDPRVVSQEAPFDHPQIFVPHGHLGDHECVTDGGGCAKDCLIEIPAVGALGGPLMTKPLPQCDGPEFFPITLTPCLDFNPVGSMHTVTARVQDGSGNPLAGILVSFEVFEGPNMGQNGSDTTDANGEATFTYTDTGGTGPDKIRASYDDGKDTITSNTAVKVWDPPSIDCPPDTTIDCGMSPDPSTTGEATGVGACSPPVTVTYEDVIIPGACQSYGSCVERTWTVEDTCGYKNTCMQKIYMRVTQRSQIHHKADLLVWPYVKIAWDVSNPSVPVHDTFISVTNDDNVDHRMKFYFVEGATGMCKAQNRALTLTGHQSRYFSAFNGQGGQLVIPSFKLLFPNGYPEEAKNTSCDGVPPLSTIRKVEGFIVGFVVDSNNQPFGVNHLAGSATVIDYTNEAAWEYKPWGFRSNFVGPIGGDTGHLKLDGSGGGYQMAPSHLLVDFYAACSDPFSTMSANSDFGLTTLIMAMDFRAQPDWDLDGMTGELPVPGGRAQDSKPPTTAVQVLTWNENELPISNAVKCLTCWDTTLASQYKTLLSAGPPASFGASPFAYSSLQTKKGVARINGSKDIRCDQASNGANATYPVLQKLSFNLPIIGVAHKIITWPGSGSPAHLEKTGSSLIGMGERTDGFVKFDAFDQGTSPTVTNPTPPTGSAVGDTTDVPAQGRSRGTR